MLLQKYRDIGDISEKLQTLAEYFDDVLNEQKYKRGPDASHNAQHNH